MNDIIDEMMNMIIENERAKCSETKEPPTTKTLNDFNYYLSVNGKSIADISDNEFIRFKNNFIIAVEKELSKYYNFVTNVKN